MSHHSGYNHGAGILIRFRIKNMGSGARLSGLILCCLLAELDSRYDGPRAAMASAVPAFVRCSPLEYGLGLVACSFHGVGPKVRLVFSIK